MFRPLTATRSLFATDFGEYPVGVELDAGYDWAATSTDNQTFTVTANSTDLSGRHVTLQKTGVGGRAVFTWKRFPAATNTNILARVKPISTTGSGEHNAAVELRRQGSATGYYTTICFEGSSERLSMYLGSASPGSPAATTGFDWAVLQKYWLRMDAQGSTIRSKVWADGTDEPAYVLSISDSTYTQGNSGLVMVGFDPSSYECDWYSAVEGNDATAPSPAG
jgi:hypothetical protein